MLETETVGKWLSQNEVCFIFDSFNVESDFDQWECSKIKLLDVDWSLLTWYSIHSVDKPIVTVFTHHPLHFIHSHLLSVKKKSKLALRNTNNSFSRKSIKIFRTYHPKTLFLTKKPNSKESAKNNLRSWCYDRFAPSVAEYLSSKNLSNFVEQKWLNPVHTWNQQTG